jgi:site-specific DNA-adenine methylase
MGDSTEQTRKRNIAVEIKNIGIETVITEWCELKKLSVNPQDVECLNGRSKIGCDLIDYYFFLNRIETIGNKGINFFEFVQNIDYYKTKKYIQNLLNYCSQHNRYVDNEIKRYYYIYGLSFGRVNAFKITNAISVYMKYKPNTENYLYSIMDPFCGFGGRLVAALLLNYNYIGVDLNVNLKPNYDRLLNDLGKKSSSRVTLLFQDAKDVDYSKYKYDMVFTSPPYGNIEVYENGIRKSPEEWAQFYTTVFQKLWDHLRNKDGVYAININADIYQKYLVPLFGECEEKIELKKSTRNNKYKEYIYLWRKNI